MPRLTVYWMFYLSTESMASIRCLYKRTTSYHLRTFPGKWTTQKSIRVRFYGVALMYHRLLSPGGLRFSWHWVWSLGPALITQLRAHESGGVRTNMSPGADPGSGKTGGMSTEVTIFLWLWNSWLIVQRYPPVDLPASVLLLSSLLLVCEALRFPRDDSPDVTNDYDDADNRIDDDVPDELQMATKIDVRDTQQLRGEI